MKVGLNPGHTVLDRGPSSPHRKGHSSPTVFSPCLLWLNCRPSQELLSSLLRPLEQLRSIVMSMSVYVSVCLSVRISPEPHARSLPNFCACCLYPWLGRLTASMTIDSIAYRRERGDRSAQRRRSVINDCLVVFVLILCLYLYIITCAAIWCNK